MFKVLFGAGVLSFFTLSLSVIGSTNIKDFVFKQPDFLLSNNQKKMVNVLKSIGKPVFTFGLSSCIFSVESSKLEDGVCTNSGACRFQGLDYMYQGGCGLLSKWGNDPIKREVQCTMMVTKKIKVKGKCTKSGHCWSIDHVKLLHKFCM